MRGKQRVPGEICADCGTPDPGWASLNRGVLVCDECCCVHRSLGRHISQVRALNHGPPWPRSLREMVYALVTNGANSIWEHSLLDPSQVRSGKRKPSPKDPIHARNCDMESGDNWSLLHSITKRRSLTRNVDFNASPSKSEFIRAKYQRLDFVLRLKEEDGSSVKDLSQQLHSSVRTGNLETCLRLLSLGAQANFYHVEKGNTPLHVASYSGQSLQCELLMAYGADPGAMDINGLTPADLAREEGHLELAERLVQCQYELTDRLTFFVCSKRPDHLAGQHFLIPEMADSSLDRSEAAEQARKKLQALSNHLFEELAMDVYDEVDRRELDAIWSSLQKPNFIGADRTVLFLPLNPELSSTRNQGRQKLARFSAREFATLIIDILKEAKRRQQGTLSLTRPSVDKETVEVHRAPPPPIHEKPTLDNQNVFDDNEPLYDSVASDEDCGDLSEGSRKSDQRGLLKEALKPRGGSSDNSDEPITLKEYLQVKKQLVSAEAKVSQLLAMNKELNQDVHMLQSMVDKLKEENEQLRAIQRRMDFPQKTHDLESFQAESAGNINRSSRGSGRPMSMIESRSHQRPFGMSLDSKPLTATQEKLTEGKSRVANINLPPISDDADLTVASRKEDRPVSQTDSDYDNAQAQPTETSSSQPDTANAPGSPPVSSSPTAELSPRSGEGGDGASDKPPTQEDVVSATDKITKRIQTLLGVATEGKVESFAPCSDQIRSAVNEMANLFPEKHRTESVKTPLRVLVSSAARLHTECKNAVPSDPSVTPDLQRLTQEIIARAYDIAKSAKQLVTCFQ
ncbi:ARF GTPase-activating protein GIT2-like isoform X2 [Acanthaster planci]|uniref:ARF GTPase-activating protein GIT2-like isoform X2 n=1 Tax=Acanthaster planci TaxID=133434 RepID=A0A8B7ZTC5_ACAPL|nr:ARF GTPase-activating protein GIT2-like isoform X2 [Acanthaster planci]